jgi:hypothetical protein
MPVCTSYAQRNTSRFTTLACLTQAQGQEFTAAGQPGVYQGLRSGDRIRRLEVMTLCAAHELSDFADMLCCLPLTLPCMSVQETVLPGIAALAAAVGDLRPTRLLPYLLYSDASDVQQGGVKFHALLAFLAGDLQLLRSQEGFTRLAMLPVVTPQMVGVEPAADKRTSAESQKYEPVHHVSSSTIVSDTHRVDLSSNLPGAKHA